jgi:hypothetical protein
MALFLAYFVLKLHYWGHTKLKVAPNLPVQFAVVKCHAKQHWIITWNKFIRRLPVKFAMRWCIMPFTWNGTKPRCMGWFKKAPSNANTVLWFSNKIYHLRNISTANTDNKSTYQKLQL